jgi:hypothetical protein
MSTIDGGHYHPLRQAGRAVRPDGYHPATDRDAAVAPRIAAIRCKCKIRNRANSQSADETGIGPWSAFHSTEVANKAMAAPKIDIMPKNTVRPE